ncbi:MAG TPA: hypothetical protein VFL17_18860 [Anaerolineae bacterium]|nr:hypothetical protein [Anaerolineae bacterium]
MLQVLARSATGQKITVYTNLITGPVGAVLMPALGGVAPWSDLPQASSLCGACREVCPVRIDIPRMLLELRNESHQAGKTPWWLKMGLIVYRFVVVRPRVFRLAIGVSRLATRVLARQGWLRRLPPPLSGWTAHRDFPAFAREPLSAQFKRRR